MSEVDEIKAAALRHGDRVLQTYYALWDKHNPVSDDEQAAIEPMTVDALEAEIGDLTPEVVDYVIFERSPVIV